jgi:hypothetical protein
LAVGTPPPHTPKIRSNHHLFSKPPNIPKKIIWEPNPYFMRFFRSQYGGHPPSKVKRLFKKYSAKIFKKICETAILSPSRFTDAIS